MNPNDYGLRQVGYWPKLIQKTFNKLCQKNLPYPYELIRDIEPSIVKRLNKIAKQIAGYRVVHTSNSDSVFFAHQSASFTRWHLDGPTTQLYGMVISAYPLQTQFLLGTQQQGRHKSYYNNGINKGKFSIFEPKEGEVWFIPPNTLHRTHTKSVNKPRLMLRKWIVPTEV